MNGLSDALRESALWLRSVLEIHGDADTLTLAGANGTSVYTRGHGLDLHVGAEKFHYPESALDGEKWELAIPLEPENRQLWSRFGGSS